MRSGRSLSEIGIGTYYHKILGDVVPNGRCASIQCTVVLVGSVLAILTL